MFSRSINVGGKFRSSAEVVVDSIEVGGVVRIDGMIKARDLEVGGKASPAGGEISGKNRHWGSVRN